MKIFPCSEIYSDEVISLPARDGASPGIFDRGSKHRYLATIQNSLRSSVNLNDSRVYMRTATCVTRIAIQDQVATGVYYLDKSGREVFEGVERDGEVILCAGVYETPRILFNSGFRNRRFFFPGDAYGQNRYNDSHRHSEQYEKLAVFERDSPGLYIKDLGEAFQYHLLVPIIGVGNWWMSLSPNRPRQTWMSLSWIILRHCFLNAIGLSSKLPYRPTHPFSSSIEMADDTFPTPRPYPLSGVERCLNGVHGWLLLDEHGATVTADSKTPPR